MIPPFDIQKGKEQIDLVTAFMNGGQPDRITAHPIIMTNSAFLHGSTIREWYINPKAGAQMVLNAHNFYNIPVMLPCAGTWQYGTPWCEDYGGVMKMPEGNAGGTGISKHPYSKIEEIDTFEPLGQEELAKGPTWARIGEAMEESKKILGPLFHGWGIPYEPFLIGTYWFGPENLLLWVFEEPKLVQDLMSKVVEHQVAANLVGVQRYGEANLTVSSLLASSQTMNPQQCWDFSLKYTKEIVDRSLKGGCGPMVWYHQCGDHEGDCKLHADLPLPKGTIMHPSYWGLNPAPLSETRKIFEDKCMIMGNVDTASFLNKTPAEIYKETAAQIEIGKTFKHGFIAGIGCEMPPYTNPANVEAFLRAVRDFGKMR